MRFFSTEIEVPEGQVIFRRSRSPWEGVSGGSQGVRRPDGGCVSFQDKTAFQKGPRLVSGVPRGVPRGPQGGPRRVPGDPKGVPGGPRGVPGRSQGGFPGVPKTTKSLQEAPWTGPERGGGRNLPAQGPGIARGVPPDPPKNTKRRQMLRGLGS